MKYYSRLNIFFAFIMFALLGATFWLWRGFWRNQQFDRAVEKQAIIESANNYYVSPKTVLVSSSISVVTTTPVALIATTTTGKAIEKNTSSPRVAVSPLTGTLVLGGDDVNLNVPYASQAPERNWEQPWQDACEEAALLMLDAYYKGYGLSPLSAKDELQKMIDWEIQQGWGGSINIENIKKIAVEYFSIKRKMTIVENPTVEQIKKFIDAGNPVLVVGDGKVLPNKYYSNGGPPYHAFIIRGYTVDTFITNDPGVNRGTNFVFPIDSVMNAMHDWNEGDVKNGRKVILVLE